MATSSPFGHGLIDNYAGEIRRHLRLARFATTASQRGASLRYAKKFARFGVASWLTLSCVGM